MANGVHLSQHAIARAQERVWPALELEQVTDRLEGLVEAAGEPVAGEPPWRELTDNSILGDAHLELSDGVALALNRTRDGWIAMTCLTRGEMHPDARFAKSIKRRKKRRRHKREQAQGGAQGRASHRLKAKMRAEGR